MALAALDHPIDKIRINPGNIGGNDRFRQVVADVLQALKGGRSFADCLAQHPKQFSELYVNMVRAGEASGSLAQVFERLVEFEKTRDELRGYIVSSLVYPALLSIVGATSIFILMYFVVPKFAQIFTEGRMEMPLPTKMLIATSNFVRSYGLFAIAALVAGIVSFNVWIRGEGRLWWDRARLRIPLLGIALRKAETARFARAMGTLVSNTVPLVQCLGIASKILNNRVMANSLDSVAQAVKRGEGLATPLKRTGEFPPLAAHLLTVGEETGKLDVMFHRMADIYEEETKTAIKRFTTLFEPLIIFVMGVVIGSLILSMLLAIASINDLAM